MTLQETIKSGIKDAMIAKDAVRLQVLRGLSSAFTNELVATNRTPQDMLSDEEVLAVIKRVSKQRKDAIEQFTAGGRPDLAEADQAELAILETFLPAKMSLEAIEEKAKEVISALGDVDASKMGIIVGQVIKACGSTADGADVKTVVQKLLTK
jgi:uncharacterized protein